ncbi:MAG: NACHT domain-containing protein, partial [Cyanobacteria bacterium J06632_22]
MDSQPPSLPDAFLKKLATRYALSDLETEAFVSKLTHTELHNRIIAKMLFISPERLRNRMTSIYRKFDIPAKKGPVKFRLLLAKVMKIYQKESPENYVNVEKAETDKLVNDIHRRIRDSIDRSCRTMRVLDISQPICVEEIYTEVKILRQISSNRHVHISDLTTDLFDPVKSEQRSGPRQPGLDCIMQHRRLMILGKPGSGKTTFLKYIAVLCNQQKQLPDYLPFFIQLRDFAEQPSQMTLADYFMAECHKNDIEEIDAQQLLKNSRILFLLDGLDEVRDCDKRFVSRQIQEFAKEFANEARHNRIIVTCRLAAQERFFEGFTEVEIADFSESQIQFFAQKWFDSHLLSVGKSGATVQEFMRSLNQHIRIRELASNPLLLTLLCLVFDDSKGFPLNRSDLYVQSLDVLLKRWDANRGIVRSQAYESLSLRRKEDLLSQIAFETFSNRELFFRNNTAEKIIEKYIRNLPQSSDDPETLRLDSQEVLNTIEIQHGLLLARARGIYSFSHLTFHEFFTARKIAKNSGPEAQRRALTHLAKHLNDPRWEEVFLLVLSMLDEADYLFELMILELKPLLGRSDKFNQLFT